MDIKYLRLVKAIVEEGNISKSADRLFLTKSALSPQLRDFEERIGVKVFIRSRNDWQLTSEGQEVYEIAKEVLTRIDQGIEKITKVQSGSRGTIKVRTECYSFYRCLPAFMQKMNALYPEIEIALKLEQNQPLISQLLSKELDICIVTNPSFNDQILTYELFEDELMALIHEEHSLSNKDYLEPSDFIDQELLIHSLPMETVSVYQYFLKPNRVEPRKVTAIPMTEVTLELLNTNMGIACYPKWALQSFRLSSALKFKSLGSNGLKRRHFLAIRAEDAHKQYIQDFVTNIQEEEWG